jgi:tetrapyrrole methylase family protein/MazG family protein
VPSRRSNRKKNSKQRKLQHASKEQSARRQIAGLSQTPPRSSRKPVGKLFETLVAVQARLRAPGGCPWDREQTHKTLRTFLIEEAYEVLDAIEKGRAEDLSEELGDLLLQVLFHADLALEAGTFDLGDVITGIRDKLIRRHPHVFGNVKAETAGEVLKNWAALKAEEKQKSLPPGQNPKAGLPSVLDGVHRSLPALLEAYQLTRRAAQVGFDWERVEGIFEKIQEESQELRSALATPNSRAAEEEVGDLLFSVVNLARFVGVDPEVALKHSNLKFKQRFQFMEEEAVRSDQALAQLSKEELEQFWVSAKSRLTRRRPT